jgi:hypothetical protein
VRRFVLLIPLAAVVAGFGASASSSARHVASRRVTCKATALTFLFWPSGHNAIPSIGFPLYPYPHMEVYKSAAGSFPDPNEVAIIEFTSSGQAAGGFASSCKTVKTKIINSKPATGKTSQATSLACTFPKQAQLEITKPASTPVSIALRVVMASKGRTAPLEVSAVMTDQPGGSTLRFDPKHCKASPPPQ